MSLRKLTATSCEVKFEGVNKNNKAFTLYEVAVVGEDGEPIMEEFKSFEMLPIGELVEYEVEREDHEKYGVSYLLRLPPGVKAGKKPNLKAEIDELRQRVARLEAQAGALTGTPPAAPTSPAMAGIGPGDDVPF